MAKSKKETEENANTLDSRSIMLRIDNLLKEKGINRQKLADDCKTSTANFSRWSNNGNLPSVDTALTIAHYFNVSLEWLLTGTDDNPYKIKYDKLKEAVLKLPLE